MKNVETNFKWVPLIKDSANFYLESFIDAKGGLKITLRNPVEKDNGIRITFPRGVTAYSMNNVGVDWGSVEGSSGTLDGNVIPLIKLSNSLRVQGYSDPEFYHFVMYTSEELLDVLCWYEPQVELISREDFLGKDATTFYYEPFEVHQEGGSMRTGTHADGRKVCIRPLSAEGCPIMEFQTLGSSERTKIKYKN